MASEEPKYTDEERRVLIGLHREWMLSLVPLLHMQAWRIRVVNDRTDDPTAIAEFAQYALAARGDIYIGDSYFDQSPEEQVETIAHELLHGIMKAFKLTFREVEHEMSKPAYRHMGSRFEDAEESVVDHLSRVLIPMLPKPPAYPPESLKGNRVDIRGMGGLVGTEIDPPPSL